VAWAFLRFTLLIGAAIPLALRQAEVWKKPPGQVIVGCLLIIAIVGAGEPFFARMRDRRKRHAHEELERVRQVMLMALADIAHIASIPCQDLGLHLYIPTTPFLRRFREASLARTLRVRLSSIPVPSDVNWTRGKGVVGSCWKQQRDVAIDVDQLHRAHYGCDEAAWEVLPEAVTMGMTFEEFQHTQGKYGWIVATPITRPTGGVIGILSVDGPCGRSSALDTGPVKTALRRLADDVQRHLSR